MSDNNELILGQLMNGVANLEKMLETHQKDIKMDLQDLQRATRDDFRAAAASRSNLYNRLDQTEKSHADLGNKVDAVKDTLDEYEPDLRQCRRFRYAGIIGGTLIAIMAGFVAFGKDVVDLWHFLKGVGK